MRLSKNETKRMNEVEGSVIYKAKYADFYSEEDSYENGAFGRDIFWDYQLDLEASSLKELFTKIKKELGMESKDFYWGVELSDMNGKTCFKVDYEGDEEDTLIAASKREIEDWKKGNQRLWLIRGTIPVLKAVKPSNVPDDEMEAFARENHLEIL